MNLPEFSKWLRASDFIFIINNSSTLLKSINLCTKMQNNLIQSDVSDRIFYRSLVETNNNLCFEIKKTK